MRLIPKKVFLLFFLIVLISISCTKKINSKDFLKWLNQSDNGLVKTKRSNGFEIKVKYLPAGYFISREINLKDSKNIPFDKKRYADSISGEFSKNIYFLLHIGNDTSVVSEKSDVMFRDIYNYGDYTSRIYKFNFDLAQDIELIKNEKTYHPVLTSFENHYGLEGGRNILLVFSASKDTSELSKPGDLEVIFNDEELGIGTTHFRFDQKDIDDIPELIY